MHPVVGGAASCGMRFTALIAASVAALLATGCAGARAGSEPAKAMRVASRAKPGRVRPVARVIGRSVAGRPIVALRAGDRSGPTVLVVGCIHGNETAGIAVTRALERVRAHADVWIVPDLNPDGVAAGTRQNRHGVDLNANWSSEWRGGGRPWEPYYAGRRPFSEPETRVARRLILRLRPRVTIWFHQHMDLVWAWGPSSAAGRLYAHASGMRFYHRHWLPGTATNWQNHRLRHTVALTVELPAGRLSAPAIRRQLHAILTVARRSR
jgi:murein peptide amidase A